MKIFSFGESVSYFKYTVIGKTDNVAGVCFVYRAFPLRHELNGRRESHCLSETHMLIRSIPYEFATAYFAKCYAGTVVGVDICRYLEDEPCKFRFFRLYISFYCLCWTRRRGYFHETVQKFLHTKVIQRRAKEHGSHIACQVCVAVECRINSVNQFYVGTQFCGILLAYVRFKVCAVYIYLHLLGYFLLIRGKEVQIMFIYIINSFKACALLNGPRQRTDRYLQFFFQFVQQTERVFTLPVHLVNEYNHGRASHTAHVHQFPRLRFDAFSRVNNNYCTVYGSQRPVSIFRKILVTGSIKDIYLIAVIIELHN